MAEKRKLKTFYLEHMDGSHETAHADEVRIENGVLILLIAGRVDRALAPGKWAEIVDNE